MKLLFIRHGETQTNVNKLTHKTGDPIGLTELGQQQAKKLAEICKNEKVEAVFSSPEQRALETAQVISKELNLDLEILEELAERNWGEWEGRAWPEIEAVLQPMSLEERYTFIPPNGESWQRMEERLKAGLDHVISRGNQVVAIITHEGALRGLMPLLFNSPKENSFKYHFENASITSFEYIDRVFKELKINDTSHL